MAQSEKLTFAGAGGEMLAARLDLPDAGEPQAFALFAHCFTCSKDIHAARRVSQALAAEGFGVLRFDFTGLGGSEGDFANTHFSSNVADLLSAAQFMRETQRPLSLLIGHSLGGAAAVAAAGDLDEVKGVATIGAPADVAHVLHNFEADVPDIEDKGIAKVTLGGRPFTIKREFLHNAREQQLTEKVSTLRRALLVMHSPTDNTVGVENARLLFEAAKHPKSFVSLDGADHLLNDPADAAFAGSVISAWARRYIMLKAKNVDA